MLPKPQDPCKLEDAHPIMLERWRMQRRMFLWFGATIFLTMFVVGGVFRLMMREGTPICKEESRVRHFHKVMFERVWDKPEERAILARQWNQEFGATVSLRDPRGHELSRFGQGSCESPKWVIDLGTPDEPKGQVAVCTVEESGASEKARNLALALLAAACTVWAISGAIARRVARPLGELTRVAQDLGAGHFNSRVEATDHRGEIGVLGHVLNDMADRIERQMADQRALLAAVSHEIRTPLARMRILVEMARDQAGELPSLDKIDAEVLEIDKLVSELLASSRIDFSALAFNPLDARRVATDALERADVDPTVLSFEAPRPIFRGDPTLVSRAVLNLIENARRYGGGVSELHVIERDGCIVFEVHDNGPGLAPDETDKIFQPFYRGSQANGHSVGLGLALVKRIAQAHGGDATATNHPDGRGACVSVSFALPGVDIPPPLPSSQSHLPTQSPATA